MPRLVINPGTASVWEVQLRPGVNTLGRGFANDFKIEHGSVSTAHCQIIVDNGKTLIRDLGSTNGTFVEDALVNETVLQPGQSISLGAVQLRFEADAPAGKAEAETSILPRPAPPVPVPIPGAARSRPAGLSVPIGARAAASFQAAPPAASTAVVPPGGEATGLRPIPPPLTGVSRPAGLSMAASASRPETVSPAIVASVPVGQFEHGSVAAISTPPIPPSPLALSGQCKFHPRTAGRYYCAPCSNFFCDLCVASRPGGAVQMKHCRHCGSELRPVAVHIARPGELEKGFYARIPGAFAFPFKGAGFLVLLVGTVLMSCLQLFGPLNMGLLVRGAVRFSTMGVMLQIMLIGYMFAYIQNILHATAAGDEEMPPLPSMANMWDDVLVPCLKMLGLVAVCFLPAIALIVARISSEDSSLGVALLPTFILCLVYFPMAFLAVAMLDSVAAANPMQIIPSIMKVPLEYLLTLGLLTVLFAMRFLGDQIIPMIFPKGLATHSMPKLVGYLGAEAFWAVACMYLLTVSMRILGLLYVTKKEKLAWL